ncbi:MAG: PorT family protein [Prevotella sp.]|nr:PorT family protein [Prevotella sp.]
MKKILLSLFTVLFAAPSFAQYSSGGFSLDESSLYYGLRLGANFAGIGGDYVDLDSKTGLNMAGVVGLRLSDTTPVFLESGLYYTERGAKKDKAKVSLTYFEVPLLIKYGIQVNDDIAVLPYVGPYFSLGIAGKQKSPAEEEGGASTSRSSYKHFKRGDMGIKVGCGAEYNKLYAEVGYQFGIANIAKENEHDLEATGHALYLNIGVNF